MMLTDYENPSHCFYAVAGYGLVRKYDMRTKSHKPALQTSAHLLGKSKVKEESFNCLSQSRANPNLLAVAGGKGTTLLLDTRMFPVVDTGPGAVYPKLTDQAFGCDDKPVVKVYASANTSLSSVYFADATTTTPAGIATCGNDKKLRIYDVNTGKITCDMFLKSRLTKVAYIPDGVDEALESELKRLTSESKAASLAKKQAALDKKAGKGKFVPTQKRPIGGLTIN